MVPLPEELLDHIFSNLRISAKGYSRNEDGVNLATMSNVSLVNRTCYRIVRPHLYHTLIWEDSRYSGRATNFLRTCLQHQGTGNLVQALHVESWSLVVNNEGHSEHLDQVLEEIRCGLLAAVDTFGLPTDIQQRLLSQLAYGVEDAQLALLLLLAPNVQYLEICASSGAFQSLVMSVLRPERVCQNPSTSAHAFVRPLQQLLEVKITHSEYEGGLNIDEFLPLVQLPMLEVLRGNMIACNSQSTHHLHQHSSSLKKIYFDWSLLDDVGLERLLTACPELEALSVHWAPATTGAPAFKNRSLGRALRYYGSKLINLRLNPRDAERDRLDQDPPLGSLREIESLRLLEVTYHALCGHNLETRPSYLKQVLPFSLRMLRIAAADPAKTHEVLDDESDDDVEDSRLTTVSVLDMQLIEVMQDSRFAELSLVKVQRRDGFTLSGQARGLGWSDESGKFGVILKKRNQVSYNAFD
ncbi:hypothetical protein LTR56_021986 [Elasticomyces elasticus]|nr:hypothetical protein LTR56_021986 [Elasticomyces elasticus]KAK3630226.1 hypothetical protein LTR22_021604 [Elasticomyces elasticus]KAK4920148.1 hypothetical protein LTR49_012247 [Elasticomyces elasticus]KAK5748957.1 hypothetical protein LTS12_020994 [Elasticomyces elasticus]